ncbi:MAG: 1-acyl-sn-glycerol-3-phosphate acyltransferase [Neomegalonema sp.]|nr:1-acyl-sn-glycerol-3-phosphate acyltransferase [Neomegalonema sp.]
MSALRNGTFAVLLVLWSLPFAALIPALSLARDPAHLVRALSRHWGRGVLTLIKVIGGIDYRVEGERPQTPTLLAASHQTLWETVALTVEQPDICIIAKASLGKIPAFGWYLRRSPMIFIAREEGASALRKMRAEAQEAAAQGRPVLIFPSGTRRALGQIAPLQRGAALLYRELGLPLTPIVHDAGLFLNKDMSRKRAGTITLRFLPAIAPGLTGQQALAELEKSLVDGEAALLAKSAAQGE